MVSPTRRNFLKGVLALTVVAAAGLPLDGQAAPTIYGDGVHDDTDGLQALIDGRPFRVDGEGSFVARSGIVSGGRFIVSKPLDCRGTQGVIITNCHFIAASGFSGPLIQLGPVVNRVALSGTFDLSRSF